MVTLPPSTLLWKCSGISVACSKQEFWSRAEHCSRHRLHTAGDVAINNVAAFLSGARTNAAVHTRAGLEPVLRCGEAEESLVPFVPAHSPRQTHSPAQGVITQYRSYLQLISSPPASLPPLCHFSKRGQRKKKTRWADLLQGGGGGHEGPPSIALCHGGLHETPRLTAAEPG